MENMIHGLEKNPYLNKSVDVMIVELHMCAHCCSQDEPPLNDRQDVEELGPATVVDTFAKYSSPHQLGVH
jgi:hypothetical protein